MEFASAAAGAHLRSPTTTTTTIKATSDSDDGECHAASSMLPRVLRKPFPKALVVHSDPERQQRLFIGLTSKRFCVTTSSSPTDGLSLLKFGSSSSLSSGKPTMGSDFDVTFIDCDRDFSFSSSSSSSNSNSPSSSSSESEEFLNLDRLLQPGGDSSQQQQQQGYNASIASSIHFAFVTRLKEREIETATGKAQPPSSSSSSSSSLVDDYKARDDSDDDRKKQPNKGKLAKDFQFKKKREDALRTQKESVSHVHKHLSQVEEVAETLQSEYRDEISGAPSSFPNHATSTSGDGGGGGGGGGRRRTGGGDFFHRRDLVPNSLQTSKHNRYENASSVVARQKNRNNNSNASISGSSSDYNDEDEASFGSGGDYDEERERRDIARGKSKLALAAKRDKRRNKSSVVVRGATAHRLLTGGDRHILVGLCSSARGRELLRDLAFNTITYKLVKMSEIDSKVAAQSHGGLYTASQIREASIPLFDAVLRYPFKLHLDDLEATFVSKEENIAHFLTKPNVAQLTSLIAELSEKRAGGMLRVVDAPDWQRLVKSISSGDVQATHSILQPVPKVYHVQKNPKTGVSLSSTSSVKDNAIIASRGALDDGYADVPHRTAHALYRAQGDVRRIEEQLGLEKDSLDATESELQASHTRNQELVRRIEESLAAQKRLEQEVAFLNEQLSRKERETAELRIDAERAFSLVERTKNTHEKLLAITVAETNSKAKHEEEVEEEMFKLRQKVLLARSGSGGRSKKKSLAEQAAGRGLPATGINKERARVQKASSLNTSVLGTNNEKKGKEEKKSSPTRSSSRRGGRGAGENAAFRSFGASQFFQRPDARCLEVDIGLDEPLYLDLLTQSRGLCLDFLRENANLRQQVFDLHSLVHDLTFTKLKSSSSSSPMSSAVISASASGITSPPPSSSSYSSASFAAAAAASGGRGGDEKQQELLTPDNNRSVDLNKTLTSASATMRQKKQQKSDEAYFASFKRANAVTKNVKDFSQNSQASRSLRSLDHHHHQQQQQTSEKKMSAASSSTTMRRASNLSSVSNSSSAIAQQQQQAEGASEEDSKATSINLPLVVEAAILEQTQKRRTSVSNEEYQRQQQQEEGTAGRRKRRGGGGGGENDNNEYYENEGEEEEDDDEYYAQAEIQKLLLQQRKTINRKWKNKIEKMSQEYEKRIMAFTDAVSCVTVNDNVFNCIKDGGKIKSSKFDFSSLRDVRCRSEFADDTVQGALSLPLHQHNTANNPNNQQQQQNSKNEKNPLAALEQIAESEKEKSVTKLAKNAAQAKIAINISSGGTGGTAAAVIQNIVSTCQHKAQAPVRAFLKERLEKLWLSVKQASQNAMLDIMTTHSAINHGLDRLLNNNSQMQEVVASNQATKQQQQQQRKFSAVFGEEDQQKITMMLHSSSPQQQRPSSSTSSPPQKQTQHQRTNSSGGSSTVTPTTSSLTPPPPQQQQNQHQNQQSTPPTKHVPAPPHSHSSFSSPSSFHNQHNNQQQQVSHSIPLRQLKEREKQLANSLRRLFLDRLTSNFTKLIDGLAENFSKEIVNIFTGAGSVLDQEILRAVRPVALENSRLATSLLMAKTAAHNALGTSASSSSSSSSSESKNKEEKDFSRAVTTRDGFVQTRPVLIKDPLIDDVV